MSKTKGGTTLTQIAVPAALFYANQLFSANRRRPIPATFRRNNTRSKSRTTKRNFKKRRSIKSRTA